MERTIYHGGNIYLERERFAQAMMVENGIIKDIGSDSDVLQLAFGDTVKVDLGGRTVVPGFNDSHMHLSGLGDALITLNYSQAKSIADIVSMGKSYILENDVPHGTLIMAQGWNQDYFTDENRLPNRHDLDKISTDHPIAAIRACHHVISLNSQALDILGLDRNTPNIDGGGIERDNQGELLGIFSENAMELARPLESEATLEERMNIIERSIKYANSYGITSVQTNDLKDEGAYAMMEAYKSLEASGRMTIRAYHQCCFMTPSGLNGFIAEGNRTGGGTDLNKIGPIKLFIDGSLGARTAVLRQDYADMPGERGIAIFPQEELDELIKTADENGFQVAVHAIGDGAIEMVLNSYDKVIKNGENPLRHGIVHCQITDIPLLERFRANDIFAYLQPIFLHYDLHIVEERVGEELAKTSYAFETMNRLGIHNGYGSDAPVEDPNTMNNIHCAVNRQDLAGFPEGGFVPSEKVDIYTAIDKYTLGSAYASHEENRKGRLKKGFLADFAVLSRDIFTLPSSEIKNITVEMTVLGGKTVFIKS